MSALATPPVTQNQLVPSDPHQPKHPLTYPRYFMKTIHSYLLRTVFALGLFVHAASAQTATWNVASSNWGNAFNYATQRHFLNDGLQYPNPYPSPGTEAPAQSVIVATTGDVIVTYNGAGGAIPAQLYLYDPVNGFGIIFDNQTSFEGDTFNLGSFAVGTELIFELYVANGPGYNFQTGSGNRNFEGLVHAYVTQDYPLAGETWAGFEDLDGGGDFDYDDFTFYVSNTTAEPVPTPALDNYPDASIQLSGNTTITPDAAPTDTTRINVSTSTDFKGRLEGDPATGIVRVTGAHPAGIYSVTVTAFNGSGVTATETFTLTVTTPVTCNPVGFSTPNTFPCWNVPAS